MDFGSILGSLPDLITAGGTLMNLFTKRKASKEVPAMNEMLQAIRGQQEYAQAAGDPSHPFFKNVVAINAENNLSDLAGGLRELIRQHSRAAARGNMGVLVNPERRDEAVASAFARELYNQNEQAKVKARDYLMATSHGLGQSAGALQYPANMQQQYAQMDANRESAIPGALANLFKFGNQAYSQYAMSDVNRNLPQSFYALGGRPFPSSYAINARY